MPWECAECRQKETDLIKINTLCHHCGKPLCDRHKIGILDDAFASYEEPASNIAYHCDSCKRIYHPKVIADPVIIRR